MKKILVTGVGAIIGYGLLRSLKLATQKLFLFGIDIHLDAVGQVWTDQFIQSPLTNSEGYFSWFKEIIKKHDIDLVIPGIEQDLHFLSDHRNELAANNIKVVLNNKELIDLSKDKWLSYKEMLHFDPNIAIPSYTENNFSFLAQTLGLPFIVKPRRSYASKGLKKIFNEGDFLSVKNQLETISIAQPIVGTDDEEYTAALFGDGKGTKCASIIFRRKLSVDGSTAKAWVIKDAELDKILDHFCQHFHPTGPTNMQFRKDGKGWKLLEINPRLSSSTSLRTAFGYNEAEMCVNFYLNQQQINQPQLKNGFAVRYIEDYIVYDRHHF